MKITYLGFNSFKHHKRGVENVIDFQSKASFSAINYYLHWDSEETICHYENLICIGIKKNFFWFLRLNSVLYKIKKRDRKVFIHSHNPLMTILSIYQSDLYTVHDALYYLTSANNYKFKKLFFLLEKILYQRTRFVHFISEYAKEMSLFSGNKKWIIIPNTSHLENFKIDIEILIQTNRIKKFNSLATKIFIVRSIEERARIDLLIEVAKYLKEENFEFFIAGKGPLLDFYSNKIKSLKLDNIMLLGYVSDNDLVQYYKDCDIVLMPAEYGEGFGLPIIEGYLFDKPVIGSDRCAIPEVICNKDFLFENTLESIVLKIRFACDNLKGSYRLYYESKFSNSMVMNSFNQLYKTIK
ncbi:glycosyltransferase [Flavobacterium sp. ZS1P14]|uniref:glycosyltransferase n=1 Tax=Flavobacterium sp. ZS1P14 TaxID=3401729 RepID=UPI003AADFFF9